MTDMLPYGKRYRSDCPSGPGRQLLMSMQLLRTMCILMQRIWLDSMLHRVHLDGNRMFDACCG